MMLGKIILQKYLKIRKGMKNVRNPHILRTLPILHFFDALKFFWDFIWFGYCLNESITLRGIQMMSEKIKLKKYFKIRILTFFVPSPFSTSLTFQNFLDFIWHGYCLNSFITLRRCSNDFQKNPNPKILKN